MENTLPTDQNKVLRVGSHIQIVFKLVDEVHPPEVSRLEDRVKAKMSFLCFAGVSRGSHHHLLHIAKAPLVITVVRILTLTLIIDH